MGKSVRYTMSSLSGLGRLSHIEIQKQLITFGFDENEKVMIKKDVDGITYRQGEPPFMPCEPVDSWSRAILDSESIKF